MLRSALAVAARKLASRRSAKASPRLGILALEARDVPSATPTAHEQYMTELVNHARANPAAAAARFGIALNEGLAANAISAAPKQPLANNGALVQVARSHAADMIAHGYFSHTGLNGSSPVSRARSGGYAGSFIGENIAGSCGQPESAATVEALFNQLFVDGGVAGRGHRLNLLNGQFAETGVGVAAGSGCVYEVQDFGAAGGLPFLTGVAYDDAVRADNFYTPGEGRGGVRVVATDATGRQFVAQTEPAGGYSLALPAGEYGVRFEDGRSRPYTTSVTVGGQNVKLDYVVGQEPLMPSPPAADPAFSGRLLAFASGEGDKPLVRVVDAASGTERFRFTAYSPAFTGGIRVATGDMNGDGVEDVITAAGVGGGPHVQVFSGTDGSRLANFLAYDANFRGGLYIAVGNFDADPQLELVTGVGTGGGPHVKTWNVDAGQASTMPGALGSFMAYNPAFRGGVQVAAGDVDGDGRAEVITGVGVGGGPHVKVFAADGAVRNEFLAYAAGFRGGVQVAAGDFDGDGRAEIATGVGPGGGPHVKVFDGLSGRLKAEALAYDAATRSGVRVAAVDRNGDGKAELVTAPGARAGVRVRVLDGTTLAELAAFDALPSEFQGGVYIG